MVLGCSEILRHFKSMTALRQVFLGGSVFNDSSRDVKALPLLFCFDVSPTGTSLFSGCGKRGRGVGLAAAETGSVVLKRFLS